MQVPEIVQRAEEQSGGFSAFVRFRNAADAAIVAAP
jgi:hypothetical protein